MQKKVAQTKYTNKQNNRATTEDPEQRGGGGIRGKLVKTKGK